MFIVEEILSILQRSVYPTSINLGDGMLIDVFVFRNYKDFLDSFSNRVSSYTFDLSVRAKVVAGIWNTLFNNKGSFYYQPNVRHNYLLFSAITMNIIIKYNSLRLLSNNQGNNLNELNSLVIAIKIGRASCRERV